MSKSTNTIDHSNKCLMFMHVPKAGGTTLHSIIDRQYKKNQILYIKSEQTHEEAFQSMEALSQEQRDQLMVVKGHMPFGLHEYLNKPFTYITFLREPVKRIISNYCYIITHAGHPLHSIIIDNKMSLKDFVLSDLSPEVDNYQTRMFSGMNTNRYINSKVDFEKCTPQDLERAISNFEKYFCLVGLTNRFDESLFLLKKYFGWSNVYYFKRKETNYRTQNLEVTDDVLDIIRERNRFDEELYSYAKKNFDKLMAEQSGSMHDSVKRFKKINDMYGKMMKVPYFFYALVRYRKL